MGSSTPNFACARKSGNKIMIVTLSFGQSRPNRRYPRNYGSPLT